MSDPNTKPQRIYRKLTPEERARHAEIREAVEAEKPELAASAKETVDRYEASLVRYLRIRGVFDPADVAGALKSARKERGLSLADLSSRTGIDEATLSELETGADSNPTLRTLQRYAEAVGRQFVLGLGEAEAHRSDEPRPTAKREDVREAG